MQRIRWVTREYFPSERFAGCVSVARNKIPSCGSRVLNTFVFLHQRCTWPAPVIPQVFGTSVSDKSPAPGRLPALFSLRQSFRATSSEPPFRRRRSFAPVHPRFFLLFYLFFLLFPFFFIFLSPLYILCHTYNTSIHRWVLGTENNSSYPKYLRMLDYCNDTTCTNNNNVDRKKEKKKSLTGCNDTHKDTVVEAVVQFGYGTNDVSSAKRA